MNRHYSKDTENYGYKHRNDFSNESLPAFFFIIALHWSGGDSSGKNGQLNCPLLICKYIYIEVLPPPAGDNEHSAYPLTDMIKNFFINFDPVHFSVRS